MNKSIKKLALIALCTSALTGVSQAAVLFNITGVPTNGFTYGTAPGDNNVINSPATGSVTGSGVSDGAAPTTWQGSSASINSFVNVTGLAVRKGRITKDKASTFLDSLADLPIEIEDATRTRLFTSVLALVGRHKLTAYDASYLELAVRHDLPIAALDSALTRAAREAGVALMQI